MHQEHGTTKLIYIFIRIDLKEVNLNHHSI